MKYVKINAETYNKALAKLREEHGSDAIPISHKYVKDGGFFNSKFFAKEIVELTAGITEKKSLSKKRNEKKVDFTVGLEDELVLPKKREYPVNRETLSKDASLESLLDNINKAKKNIDANENIFKDNTKENLINNLKLDDEFSNSLKKPLKTVELSNVLDSQLPEPKRGVTSLEKEVRELKEMVGKLLNKKEETVNYIEKSEVSDFYDILEKNDFGKEFADSMILETKKSLSSTDLKDKYKIEKNLKDLIKNKIVTTGPIQTGNRKKVILFVGPT